MTAAGAVLLVDLPETVSIEDGDALLLEDGRPRRGRGGAGDAGRGDGGAAGAGAASPGTSATGTPRPRSATGWIRVQRDHVIEDMLAQLGAAARPCQRAVPAGGRRLRPRPDPRPPPRRRGRGSERRTGITGTGRERRASRRCKSSPPGFRPAIRSVPTATPTGWNGRSRRAWSPTVPGSQPGSADLLEYGAGRTDAMLLAAAWRAEDPAPVAELAEALAPSSERHLETMAQGAAFARATSAAWGIAVPAMAYPVAGGPCGEGPAAAARADGHALSAGLRGQRRLGRGAADPARADRGAAHPRGSAAAGGAGRRGGHRGAG